MYKNKNTKQLLLTTRFGFSSSTIFLVLFLFAFLLGSAILMENVVTVSGKF